jgi:hypothetical protein
MVISGAYQRDRCDAMAAEEPNETVGPCQCAGETDPEGTEGLPGENGVADTRPPGDDTGIVAGFSDGYDEIGDSQERVHGGAEVPPWRHGSSMTPWLVRIHGEQGQGRPHGGRLQHAVQHEYIRFADSPRKGQRARGGNDDRDATRLENSRGEERLVPHLSQRIIRRHDARAPGTCPVGVPHQRDTCSPLRQLACAGDGQRCLARTSQRRATYCDDARAGRDGQRTR